MIENTDDFTAEDILKDYTVSTDPVSVLLPDGRTLLFSPLPSTKARKEMNKRIDSFLKTIPGQEDKGHKDHFISKLPPMDSDQMRASAEIHLRAIKPHFPAATAFALHQAPTVIEQIRDKLDVADKELMALWYVNLSEEAKKKSQTLGSEDGSESAEGSSPEEIPTI